MDDSAPLFEVEETPFGYHYASTRKPPPGREDDRFHNVRITPAIFPTGRIIRGPIMDFLVWETPDDDYSTSTFITVYANQPIEESWILGILGLDDESVWTEQDCSYRGPWESGRASVRERVGKYV